MDLRKRGGSGDGGRCEEWREGKLRSGCNIREKNKQNRVEGTKPQFSFNKHRIYNLNAKITITLICYYC